MKRFASVWLPAWPITRLSRAAPSIVPEDAPFAIVDLGKRGIVIKAVNAAAARQGIVPGIALADARAALPALRARPGESREDSRALFKLTRWASRYGPCRNHDGQDGFWCDITGVAHLYGGEQALARDLSGRLAALRIPARVALADTYGAAHALARFGVAADRAFRIAPAGGTQAALAPLPVAALRLEDDVVVLLRRLGLKRIGDLYAIPRSSLAQRFSSREVSNRVVLRLDQALGAANEPLPPYIEREPFNVRQSFAEPLISSAGLEAVIAALCDDLACALKDKGMGARALRLVYYRADGTAGVTAATLRSPRNDAAHFKLLLKERLARIEAGFGIDLVELEARRAAPLDAPQEGFAEAAAAYDPGPLIDVLSNRLGAESVTVFAPKASHIPERREARAEALSVSACLRPAGHSSHRSSRDFPHSQPLAKRGSGAALDYTPPWPYGTAPRRPPFMLARPEPIAVVAEVPDGPPARFTWRRVERRVARAQGPERIAPEWWRAIGREPGKKSARARDYYEIEDETGAAYWVFRHGLYGNEEDEGGEPPCWFLHGVFA